MDDCTFCSQINKNVCRLNMNYILRCVWGQRFMMSTAFDQCGLGYCTYQLFPGDWPEKGSWPGLSDQVRASADSFASAFWTALAPVQAIHRHGGWVSSCLTHCITSGLSAGYSTTRLARAVPPTELGPASTAPRHRQQPQGALTAALAFELFYHEHEDGHIGHWWVDHGGPLANPTC